MNHIKKDRIAFIGSSTSFISAIIFQCLLDVIKDRKDIEVSCVVDSLQGKRRQADRMDRIRLFMRKVWGPRKDLKYYNFENFIKKAHRYNVPELIPTDYKINKPEFIETLANKANVIFSCANLQILNKDFVNSFEYCINYHNSLLPQYRGVGATAISIYNNEKVTCFTYHILDLGIDEGNVLLSGHIPVDGTKSTIQHEWEKTLLAANKLEELICLIKKRSQGTAQVGEASYYSKSDFYNMFTIHSLEDFEFKELDRKIHVFGGVIINNHFVTEISLAKKGIPIKDGYIKIKRISCLPPFIYNICNYMRKIGRKIGTATIFD